MEVCTGFELIVIENATALGHDVLELGKRGEAQMIGHMRHGSPPRLLALQSILSPNRREPLPTPSAGVRITYPDGTFDRVISSLALDLIPEPERAASEMCRVTKPGGIVAVSKISTRETD